MFAIFMLIIGIVVGNHLWLYLALGLSGLAAILNAIKNAGVAAKQRTEALSTANEILKQIKSTLN